MNKTEKKLILIVEDNMINREILSSILSDDYNTLEAENGKEALEILSQYKDEVALILLDIQMPVMDGYTFLEKLKAVPEYAQIPVIVTTQGNSEDDEVNALAHGATDFVPKPYRPRIILHRAHSLINFRETSALANQFKFDRLTGIYSKDYFCQLVQERLRQNPEQEYDIICSNIENFKLFNDAFGVRAGDKLLREMAGCFLGFPQESEVFGRFGADHFVWMRVRSQEYQKEVFLEVNRKLNELLHAKNITLRWGIYPITDCTLSVEQMCDRALLAANSIRGQYHKYFSVYNDTLRDKLLREQLIVDNMELAIEEGQFEVYLQPKICLADGRLAGAESLVRWIHPEQGFISPGEFIPIFEKNGFVTKLDQFVWERTCCLLKRFREKGYPSFPISVNVSRADFYQPDLPETLLHLVQDYELEPKDLHLEITESAYTENPHQILNTVKELRKCGFVIELDDFGSGYSSLNTLNQMELDIMKLDRGFILSEMSKQNGKGILKFIVELAHSIDLAVVAEGIETREQVISLKKMGCDYAQGFFFARPMPWQEYEKILEEEMKKAAETDK